MEDTPATRLARARIAAGYKTRQAFVDAHNLGRSAYYAHESGNRGLKINVADEYAAMLGNCSAAWLLTGDGQGPGFDVNVVPAGKMGTTTVVGVVQAGDWREVIDWPPEEQYPVMTPVNGFHETDLFALEVRGNSINLAYPDGSIVVCVSLPALGANQPTES